MDFPSFNRYFILKLSAQRDGKFICTLKLKLWDVEMQSRIVPRNVVPLTTLAPEALAAFLIDYFVCHDRSIKIDHLINVQPIIGLSVF